MTQNLNLFKGRYSSMCSQHSWIRTSFSCLFMLWVRFFFLAGLSVVSSNSTPSLLSDISLLGVGETPAGAGVGV